MSLKSKLAHWLINRNLKNRNRTVDVMNLGKAKTAGILWNCDDRAVYKQLISKLREHNVETTGFCFSNELISIKGESVFTKKDFSRYGIPKSEEVKEFINTSFDLLIDISLSDEIYAQAVRALSKAHFKTGWSNAEPNYFDLRIEVNHRKEPSFLAEQLLHYLEEINKN
ncbi:DUF6913 domain-containing protein [Sunxiuqinia sp. A32]|uniref:DUF6913 domain-containing protein n=1 Tax=Sunxiuqinia sp. A32 TaxID=3461496 RepID=UPI0040463B7A